MTLRVYTDGDREALSRLGEAAFGAAASSWVEYFDPAKNVRLDPGAVRVVEEGGAVRASATVIPLEAYVGGRVVPLGGVAAVMAHPAYRRRGYAGDLMRAVLRGMREDGVYLSALWPFSHSFYRTYGWELAGESVSYELSPRDLPRSPEQRAVRAFTDDDLPRVMGLLEDEASRHPLCARRSEAYWRQTLDPEGCEVAVYDAGEVEGYVLYEMTRWESERSPRRTLKVHEIVASTPAAREGLVSFAAAQNPLVFDVRYSAPRGEPLHPFLSNSYVEAKVAPEFMARIVDVEGALGLLDRSPQEPFVIEVADDAVPENEGEYTVTEEGIVRGVEAGERVRLDVRRLAQLYAGYLEAEWLARHGAVEAGSTRALELLGAYFPAGDPWMFPRDHF